MMRDHPRYSVCVRIAVVSSLSVLSARTVFALPILSFSAFQDFANAAQIVSTETFDEFSSDTVIGVGTLTLDEITYASLNPSAIWFVSDTSVTPSPPNSLVQSNLIAPVILHLDLMELLRTPRARSQGRAYVLSMIDSAF
jgi:hypothetical protein